MRWALDLEIDTSRLRLDCPLCRTYTLLAKIIWYVQKGQKLPLTIDGHYGLFDSSFSQVCCSAFLNLQETLIFKRLVAKNICQNPLPFPLKISLA